LTIEKYRQVKAKIQNFKCIFASEGHSVQIRYVDL